LSGVIGCRLLFILVKGGWKRSSLTGVYDGLFSVISTQMQLCFIYF